ncbi:MAG: DUF3696 domain-containing protein [Candidatus Lambdaproteobacteria bacterium]|nr:DUF3696 domain-containing protein [Candidatus Lambdaproteobacteria bacterium]
MKIFIKNVRSFVGQHELPIRPLTILLGENSTGKTTFLSILASISNSFFPGDSRIFRQEPYDLGGFDTITSYRGGRGGRAHDFSLGFQIQAEGYPAKLFATYVEDRGQPTLSHFLMETKEINLDLNVENRQISGTYKIDDEAEVSSHRFSGGLPSGVELSLENIPSAFILALSKPDSERRLAGKLFSAFHRAQYGISRSLKSVKSIAPIRTKPRRTYDKIIDEFRPEGDHIPFVLARSFWKKEARISSPLYKALVRFGQESGLFNDIDVSRFGTRLGSPFRVMVQTAGPAANLTDVGYGVSQSLPVVVESATAKSNTTLLLQQPEVHLHPRAQAALASFMVELASAKKCEYVIETHSDFIVDRTRQEIANGRINKDDVIILFFSKRGTKTTIYPIELDELGNLVNPPSSYREFFLNEESNLLMRGD